MFEYFTGLRYLLNRARVSLSIISLISIFGVMLGVMALVSVVSVAGGFEDEFRDKVLRNSALGRLFIRFYYRYSPTWVEHLKDKKRINALIRSILDKFINIYKHE